MGESKSNRPYWWQFFWIGVGMFVYTICRTGFPVGIAAMGKQLHFTPFEAAVLGTIFLLGQAVIDVPAGYWADRIDRKALVIVGLLGIGVFTALVTTVRSFWSVAVLRVLFGIFEGVYNVAQFAIIGSILPESRALVNGLTQVFYGLGNFSGQRFVGSFLQAHQGSWQPPLLWLGGVTIAFGILGLQVFKRPYLRRFEVKNEMSEGNFWHTLGLVVRNVGVWKAIAIQGANIIPNWVLLGVGSYIFIHFRHYSPGFTSLVFGVGFGVGGLFAPLATFWADRIGRRPVVAALGAWTAVMLLLMFYVAPPTWVMVAFSAAADMGIGALYTLGYTLAQDAVAGASMAGIGVATGMAGGFGYFFAMLAGPITGALIGVVGQLWAMNITCIGSEILVVIFALWFLKGEKRPALRRLGAAPKTAP